MGEVTGISWTDHTFNPWWGCTKVSPGCDNCYAETFSSRLGYGYSTRDGRGFPAIWGKGAPRKTFGAKHWNEPVKWNRDAERAGRREMVFCASMADVMDDEAPAGERERLWMLIDETPNLIWQLLTKRPQRYMRYLPKEFKHCNVWLGTTCENQEQFEIRADHLIDASVYKGTPAWISYEPALGPLTLSTRPNWDLDWIIFGGESGNGRRECKREWADALLAECRERNINFFMKQMGARTPAQGKALIPTELLIHQFPE